MAKYSLSGQRTYPVGWAWSVDGIPLWLWFVDLFASFAAGLYACAIVDGGVSACAVAVIAGCAAVSAAGHTFARVSLWLWQRRQKRGQGAIWR